MDKNLVNSHDKFFKTLFLRKEDVKEFLSKTLPKELVKNIDLKTLELDNSEYIDENLKSSFSDIVYNCKYRKKTLIKISILFEHKSYPEKHPHLQLLSYMLNIWQKQIKQKQELTPVIPIIFYHGKQKWNKNTLVDYFNNIDSKLQKFIPEFEYKLIDTSNYSDSEIKNLFQSLELQIGLLLLKNIFDNYKILQGEVEIFSSSDLLLQTEEGEQYFEAIVAYLYYNTDFEIQKFIDKMRTISPRAEEKFVSTAMRLEMKGRKEGREEGRKKEREKIAINFLNNGVSIEIVTLSTGLTKEELLKLQEEYNHKN